MLGGGGVPFREGDGGPTLLRPIFEVFVRSRAIKMKFRVPFKV